MNSDEIKLLEIMYASSPKKGFDSSITELLESIATRESRWIDERIKELLGNWVYLSLKYPGVGIVICKIKGISIENKSVRINDASGENTIANHYIIRKGKKKMHEAKFNYSFPFMVINKKYKV